MKPYMEKNLGESRKNGYHKWNVIENGKIKES